MYDSYVSFGVIDASSPFDVPPTAQGYPDDPQHPCRLYGVGITQKSSNRYAPPMPRLTKTPNLMMATLWVDWLRAERIGASVQREYLRSAAGELPPDQCLPEVWIDDPSQEAKAHELLHILRHVPQRRWLCSCGERIVGGFEQCWNCGAMMPSK